MKKLLVCLFGLFLAWSMNAQVEQIQKGNWVIDANTTVGSIGGTFNSGTSFLLSTADGETIWNVGAEVGYFVNDRFAIKAGLGHGDFDGRSITSYKVGAKYYAVDVVPIQVDFSGQTGEDFFGDDDPAYIGVQAGYAIFIGNQVSLEPSLRYNLALDSDVFENIFQIQIGFSIFL